MDIDEQRVLQKVAYIREQVAAIKELLETTSREDILNNQWLLRGIKYSLQTAIEAMIDLAYHLVAKKYNYPPADARDAIQALKEQAVISASAFETYTKMVGFRNRLVHGYQEISPPRLFNIISTQLGDFEGFISSVLRVVQEEKNKG